MRACQIAPVRRTSAPPCCEAATVFPHLTPPNPTFDSVQTASTMFATQLGRMVQTALLLLSVAAGGCAHETRPLRLGTTYTVQQSGALAVLESLWTGAPLATVIAPSGQILRSAANGDLDIVITHAPALEARFLDSASATLRCPLVVSRFAVVGPAADRAGVARANDAADALRRIARARATFVSRGDSSGTHVKALALWRAAGEAAGPRAPWYFESGADQATTLHPADERDAYALADLPTFAQLAGLRLQVLFSADTALVNPYTLYVVRTPDPHPAAPPFAQWTTTVARDSVLRLRLRDGVARD